MGMPLMSNIGSYVKSFACGGVDATAGGAGDATAVTGATINRRGYNSMKVVLFWMATLASAKTLSIAVEWQDGDGTNWNTATALQAATVVKTGACTAAIGTVEFNVDLNPADSSVRVNFTPDLSATGTDTAIVTAIVLLGGAEVIPA